jgi:hypothetical protein
MQRYAERDFPGKRNAVTHCGVGLNFLAMPAILARSVGGGISCARALRLSPSGTADCSREILRGLKFPRRRAMTIKVGDKLPAGKLSEFVEVETAGCAVGPNSFDINDLTRGKKVAIFGLPGAFTPTCSAKHVPSYVANIDKLKAKA